MDQKEGLAERLRRIAGEVEARDGEVEALRCEVAALRNGTVCDVLACFPSEAQVAAHHASGGSWLYYVPRSGEAHLNVLPSGVWQVGTVLVPLDARGLPCKLLGGKKAP